MRLVTSLSVGRFARSNMIDTSPSLDRFHVRHYYSNRFRFLAVKSYRGKLPPLLLLIINRR